LLIIIIIYLLRGAANKKMLDMFLIF